MQQNENLAKQPEQAEAERPEVVAVVLAQGFGRVCEAIDVDTLYQHCSEGEPLMTVAQHERIVGALRAVITQLRQHKNDYMDAGQETYRALQNEIRDREAEIARLDGLVSGHTAERDAALARVAEHEAKLAELERQEPVSTERLPMHIAYARAKREVFLGSGQEDVFRFALIDLLQESPLYAAPVAQAKHSVPGDIMRDAQRYRWLRDQQFYFSFSTENSDAGISSCTAGMSSRFKNLSWVDAAIDSAIAAAPGKEVGHE